MARPASSGRTASAKVRYRSGADPTQRQPARVDRERPLAEHRDAEPLPDQGQQRVQVPDLPADLQRPALSPDGLEQTTLASAAAEDEGMPRQLGQRHRGACPERVQPGEHGPPCVAPELAGEEPRRREREHRRVHQARLEPAPDLLVAAAQHAAARAADAATGTAPPARAGRWRRELDRTPMRSVPRSISARRRGRRADVLHPIEHRAGPGRDPLAGLGERDPRPGATDERHPELLLQRGDGLTHPGLRPPERPGRPAESPERPHLHQHPQLSERHHPRQ